MSTLKNCETCLAAVPPGESECPYCGYRVPDNGHALPFETVLNDLVREEPEATQAATIYVEGKPVHGDVIAPGAFSEAVKVTGSPILNRH